MRIELDDNGELHRLEVDLTKAPRRIQFGITKTLSGPVGRVMNRAMREDAAGHKGNWFGIPGTEFVTDLDRHVSHEMVDPFELEVGIEKKGSGKLAHIIVFGSVNNAPVYDHTAALRRNERKIRDLLGDQAVEDVLGGDSE